MAVLGGARRSGRTETVGERTRLDILEATERLLALNGPAATSIRNIAAKAEVNVAAVNYHFHSKDGLIDELLRRRLAPLNDARLRLLDLAVARVQQVPTLEAILEAFVVPMLRFASEESVGARALVAAQFLSRAANKPGGLNGVDATHAQVERRFLGLLARALPGIDGPTLRWRYSFLEGALTLAMCGPAPEPSHLPASNSYLSGSYAAMFDVGMSRSMGAAELSEVEPSPPGDTMNSSIANFIAFAAGGLRSDAPQVG